MSCSCFVLSRDLFATVGDRRKAIGKFRSRNVDCGVGTLLARTSKQNDETKFHVLTALHVVANGSSDVPQMKKDLVIEFSCLLDETTRKPVQFALTKIVDFSARNNIDDGKGELGRG